MTVFITSVTKNTCEAHEFTCKSDFIDEHKIGDVTFIDRCSSYVIVHLIALSHFRKHFMQASSEILCFDYNKFIKKIWVIENSSNIISKVTSPMIPDGCFEIKIIKGTGFIIEVEKTSAKCLSGIYLCGQGSKTICFTVLPKTKAYFIKLTTWQCSLISNFKVDYITNNVIPLSEVNKSLSNRIIRKNPTFELDKIIGLIVYEMECNYSSNKDYSLIYNTCYNLSNFHFSFKKAKSTILFEHKITSKTLENKFKNFVGLTPKQYALIIKLRALSETIYYNNNIESLTSLSYDYGFFDQSHFIHSFKSLLGISPGKMQKEDFFIPKTDERFRYYTI